MAEEDLWAMEYQSGKLPSAGIPMGAVVTTSGTGAEMNAGAVITYEEKLWKGPLAGTAAAFAVLDPAYTATVPPMQVFSGAFDTLSHAMETYLGTSDADNVSDDVALAIMSNTVTNMRRLLVHIDDMQARGNLMWDSAMAENGILKVGRLTDFQAHQIEHQLGAYTDCNHGQGLAVIQPVYYRHILPDAEAKFTRLAQRVFGAATAEAGLDSLSALIQVHPAYYRHIVKDARGKFTRFAQEVFGVDTAEAGVEAMADFIKEAASPTKMSESSKVPSITAIFSRMQRRT